MKERNQQYPCRQYMMYVQPRVNVIIIDDELMSDISITVDEKYSGISNDGEGDGSDMAGNRSSIWEQEEDGQ